MASGSPSSGAAAKKMDPVVRNAMRFAVSPREYKLLHKYLISRSPTLAKNTPGVGKYEAAVENTDDFNAAAFRAASRVFLASQAGLKLWDVVVDKILKRSVPGPRSKTPFLKSKNLRLSVSVSGILLLHRLLYRFFSLLRRNLLTSDARLFRIRNPRISKMLLSKLAPAIGASLAGLMLAVYPSEQLRVTVAIYTFSRAVEFLYNKFDKEGYFENKPWWWGSWLIMPFSCGQLLHAFVFDRDCFPASFGDFILKHTPNYIQKRPEGYNSNLPWPSALEIVDNIGKIADLNYPPFVSPILFPNKTTLPASLSAIAPVTDAAHPAIQKLSCALLHPHDTSCLRENVQFWLGAFPSLARFFTVVYTLFALPRIKLFAKSPVKFLNSLAFRILSISTFVTGAIGTSWGAICFFQQYLPRTMLTRFRFFLGGFMGGLWAILDRAHGRDNFLYTARLSIDSSWKVARKRGWVKGNKYGDVLLFVGSLAALNYVYERQPDAIDSGIAKGLTFLRGDMKLKKKESEKE